MPRTADVIIIGGGVIGSSIAYHLARRGVRHVTLVEKEFLASGATGKSSACIRQHYSNVETARMALVSLRFFEHFEELTGGRTAYFTRTGYLLGVPAPLKAAMEASVALQQSVGITTRLVSPQEMAEIEPRVRVDDFAAGCYEPDSGYADPAATTMGLAGRAREWGVTILEQTPVTGILTEGERVTGVRTAKGEILAPTVINAAGVWGDRIGRMIGLEIPLTVCRHKVNMIARPDDAKEPHPMVYDFVNQIYTRPEPGGLTLVATLDPIEAEDRVDPDSYDGGVDFETTVDNMRRATHRYPCLERGTVAKGYSGVFDVTPDWHPILDEAPGLRGFYISVGFSGHGFKLSPAIGEMMAEVVAEGKKANGDIQLFGFSRFTEGRPVRGKYDEGLMC